MRRIAAATLICALPFAALAGEDLSDLNDLPVLPVSAVQAADRAAKSAVPEVAPVAAAIMQAQDSEQNVQTRHLIKVKPGVNEIITISLGHTNRVLMPFDNPRIRTTSNAGFEVEGRAVYITSNDEGRPVTAFINDADNPELALSLTFVPKRMPPMEVELQIDSQGLFTAYRPSQKAKAWEESQPYVETLRELLREVAIGKTPQGYSLNDRPAESQMFDGCRQSGLLFDFRDGQVLEGHRLRVNIGIVENRSGQLIELREPACSGADVRAVAAWPNPLLQPGEKSEVYVVRSIETPEQAPHNARRSLLQE
jgi:conjugal transfer pilus assembly protein TraK